MAHTNTNKISSVAAGDGSDLYAKQPFLGKHERDGVHREKARLSKRARIGKDWDGKAANDNIAWPLATALIREKNTDLLKYAMAYRKIYDTAKSDAVLGGSGVQMRDGFALDRHITIRPNGTIAYKHIRKSEAASVDIPAKRYVPPFDDEDTESQRNSIKVPKPWNGDKPVNDKIDAQAQIASLQHRLGYLCEPLEMAVVDGATYFDVGKAAGEKHKVPATAVGRALVHTALITLRDALGKITRIDLSV